MRRLLLLLAAAAMIVSIAGCSPAVEPDGDAPEIAAENMADDNLSDGEAPPRDEPPVADPNREDYKDGSWSIIERNADGKIILRTRYDPDGTVSRREEVEYDSEGKRIGTFVYDTEGRLRIAKNTMAAAGFNLRMSIIPRGTVSRRSIILRISGIYGSFTLTGSSPHLQSIRTSARCMRHMR